MTQEKSKGVYVNTPVGRFSFPYLWTPNTRFEADNVKLTTDFLIYTETLNSNPVEMKLFTELKEAVLFVGREFFKNDSLTLKDFKNPFNPPKLTDNDAKITDPEQKGAIVIKAAFTPNPERGRIRPLILGPDKKEWGQEQIVKIKGGDWGRLNLSVFGYNAKGNTGVSFSLCIAQFWKEGKSFGGGGIQKSINMLSEMEIPVTDAPDAGGLSDMQSKLF